MADEITVPEGLTLVKEPEQVPLPQGAVAVPEGLTLVESPGAKLSREMEHKPFTPGISDETLEAMKDRAPAAIGGAVFGLATGGAGLLPATGMAALGGGFGEGMKDLWNFFYDPEDAPEGFKGRALSIATAAGEEAFAEMGGRVIGSVAGAGYHIVRPKVRGGIDGLQKLFSQYGGSFTTAQRSDAWLVQQADSIVRGSLTGRGVMVARDDLNDAALNLWRNDLSNMIAKGARQNMSDADFGALVADTLGDGKAAFKSYIGELYNGFDDLVKTNVRQSYVPKINTSPILDKYGKPIVTETVEKVVEEFRPVDVRPLKVAAAKLLSRLDESANLAKSDFGGATLDKIMALDDALKFSTAQEARSTLLDLSRSAQISGDAKLAGSLKHFSKIITTAMDDAAKKQGPRTAAKYARIKEEANTGYRAFNSKFVFNLLKDDANLSKVANDMFRDGNLDTIVNFRKALKEAAKYDDRIRPDEIMGQVKQKYMEYALSKSTRHVEIQPDETAEAFAARAGVPSAQRLSEFFGKTQKTTSMQALLTPSEQKALFDFAKALQVTQTPNEASLGMVMQLTQAGVALQAAQGQEGALRRAVSFFAPTKIMAHMMSNPTAVKLMTSAAKTPIWAKQAPVISTKLMLFYQNAKREVEGKETLAKDVGDYLADTGKTVFDYGKRVLQ